MTTTMIVFLGERKTMKKDKRMKYGMGGSREPYFAGGFQPQKIKKAPPLPGDGPQPPRKMKKAPPLPGDGPQPPRKMKKAPPLPGDGNAAARRESYRSGGMAMSKAMPKCTPN